MTKKNYTWDPYNVQINYGECPCRSSDCYSDVYNCWVAFAEQYPDVWEQVNCPTFRKHWVDVYQGIHESGESYVKELYQEACCDHAVIFDQVPYSEIDWSRVWEIETVNGKCFDIDAGNTGQVHIFNNI